MKLELSSGFFLLVALGVTVCYAAPNRVIRQVPQQQQGQFQAGFAPQRFAPSVRQFAVPQQQFGPQGGNS